MIENTTNNSIQISRRRSRLLSWKRFFDKDVAQPQRSGEDEISALRARLRWTASNSSFRKISTGHELGGADDRRSNVKISVLKTRSMMTIPFEEGGRTL